MDATPNFRNETQPPRGADRPRRRDREQQDDDLPTLSPLPAFKAATPRIGHHIWVVSKRREKATLCEIKTIADGLVQVMLGRETRRPTLISIPVTRLVQVGNGLWRAETD